MIRSCSTCAPCGTAITATILITQPGSMKHFPRTKKARLAALDEQEHGETISRMFCCLVSAE